MGFKNITLYNPKKSTKIGLKFSKNIVTFVADIVSHKDKIYILRFSPQTTIDLRDEEVDRVDPVIGGKYKFFMVCDNDKHKPEDIQTMLMRDLTVENAPDMSVGIQTFPIEKIDYDAQFLSDELFAHVKKGLMDFGSGKAKDIKPYYPLASLNVINLMEKMFGEVLTAVMTQTPSVDILTLIWLHGYSSQSAFKKTGVIVEPVVEDVSKAEIDEKMANQKEFMDKFADTMQRYASGELKLKDDEEAEGDDADSDKD
jgi:hypothetical protein